MGGTCAGPRRALALITRRLRLLQLRLGLTMSAIARPGGQWPGFRLRLFVQVCREIQRSARTPDGDSISPAMEHYTSLWRKTAEAGAVHQAF